MSHEEHCETCGAPATAYDYDQYKVFCDQHIEQLGFTVPLDEAHHVRTTWADGLKKEHIDAVQELLK